MCFRSYYSRVRDPWKATLKIRGRQGTIFWKGTEKREAWTGDFFCFRKFPSMRAWKNVLRSGESCVFAVFPRMKAWKNELRAGKIIYSCYFSPHESLEKWALYGEFHLFLLFSMYGSLKREILYGEFYLFLLFSMYGSLENRLRCRCWLVCGSCLRFPFAQKRLQA